MTVHITRYDPPTEIAWTIEGQIKPQIGHVYGYRLEPTDTGTLVTSYLEALGDEADRPAVLAAWAELLETPPWGGPPLWFTATCTR